MAVRKIIQVGHPSLRVKNKKITSFVFVKLKKLLKDLRDTMYKTELVGIAAPQIAENFMVFVTHPRTTRERKTKLGKKDKFRVYINLEITYRSKSQSIIYEGCGSVVNGAIFGPVKRPSELSLYKK